MELKDLYNPAPMAIISYLSKRPKKEDCVISTLAKKIGISKSSASKILNFCNELGILERTEVGRAIIYEAKIDNPFFKQFRIYENILKLQSLVKELSKICRRIILFGSCARGEDTLDSDIDLFVLVDTDEVDNARLIIREFNENDDISPVIVDQFELIHLEKEDKVFYEEIMKGIEIYSGGR